MTRQHWFTVVNPEAGRNGLSVTDIESLLASRGVRSTVIASESVEHLREVVSAAAASGSRHFVSVGGDGTAHHLINGLSSFIPDETERFAMAIIPSGSGSDFVRTLAIRETSAKRSSGWSSQTSTRSTSARSLARLALVCSSTQ